jgi:hypothetical protein
MFFLIYKNIIFYFLFFIFYFLYQQSKNNIKNYFQKNFKNILQQHKERLPQSYSFGIYNPLI